MNNLDQTVLIRWYHSDLTPLRYIIMCIIMHNYKLNVVVGMPTCRSVWCLGLSYLAKVIFKSKSVIIIEDMRRLQWRPSAHCEDH